MAKGELNLACSASRCDSFSASCRRHLQRKFGLSLSDLVSYEQDFNSPRVSLRQHGEYDRWRHAFLPSLKIANPSPAGVVLSDVLTEPLSEIATASEERSIECQTLFCTPYE